MCRKCSYTKATCLRCGSAQCMDTAVKYNCTLPKPTLAVVTGLFKAATDRAKLMTLPWVAAGKGWTAAQREWCCAKEKVCIRPPVCKTSATDAAGTFKCQSGFNCVAGACVKDTVECVKCTVKPVCRTGCERCKVTEATCTRSVS